MKYTKRENTAWDNIQNLSKQTFGNKNVNGLISKAEFTHATAVQKRGIIAALKSRRYTLENVVEAVGLVDLSPDRGENIRTANTIIAATKNVVTQDELRKLVFKAQKAKIDNNTFEGDIFGELKGHSNPDDPDWYEGTSESWTSPNVAYNSVNGIINRDRDTMRTNEKGTGNILEF